MASVQSFIRTEVCRGEFPAPNGDEAFAAYAIAAGKGLIPEMEKAARQTLNHPMTFEVLGEGLRLFESWTLCDLVYFRKRCRDNFITCLDSFLEIQPPGPSSIWVGCPEVMSRPSRRPLLLPRWLEELLSRNQNDLKLQKFTQSLNLHSRIRLEYFMALQNHGICNFCSMVHITNGSTFCAELENRLAQARDEVTYPLYGYQVPRGLLFVGRR